MIAGALLSAALVSACGGGDDATTDSAASSTSGESHPAATTTTSAAEVSVATTTPATTTAATTTAATTTPATTTASTSTTTTTSKPASTTAASTTTASASAVTVLGAVTAATPFTQDPSAQVQVVGTYPAINTLSEPGITYSGTVLGSAIRFGRVADPTGSGRTVFRHALSVSDPATAGDAGVRRADIVVPNGTLSKETVYWSAMEVYIPENSYSAADAADIAAVHIGADCCSANWEVQLRSGQMQIAKTWGDTGSGGTSTWTNVAKTDAPSNTWLKIIVEYKLSASSTTGAFIKIWINGKQVYNDTGPNSSPLPGDYAKFGYYVPGMAAADGDASRPQRELFWRSYSLVKDNGYTLDQITALLQ